MIFFLDVDNKERFKLLNNIVGSDLRDIKELAQEIRTSDERIHMDIKNLGVLEVDDIRIDYAQRAAIFKCSLIYDYRKDEKEVIMEWIKIDGGSG